MISKMTALIVVCVTVTSILVLGTQGEITITSEPEKAVYHGYFTLTCHIGTITDEVKWIYKGKTYFSCASPYSAGLCFINTTASYYNRPTYDVNTTAGISTVRMYMYVNEFEGLWTCHHGRDSSTYTVSLIDYDKRASISSFTSSPSNSTINVGTAITFTCTVSSTKLLPVNVSISSQNREGNLTYFTKSTSRTFSVSTIVQCTDYRFYCTAYNGYVSTTTLYKNVRCPVTLLRDKTTTTVNATVGSYSTLRAYYSGYPRPSYTWYRRSSQVEVKLYNYGSRASWSHRIGRYISLQINKVYLQDAGQYSVHINATGKVFIVVFTLNVNPAPTSNCIAERETAGTRIVDTLQHNTTIKAEQSTPATPQPFISAAGLGIGIAVGIITTFLILGVFLLVTRTLKSLGVKDKEVKTKSNNKGQDKNKQSDYDNTAYIPSEEETYENLEVGPN
ncbi:uncharacterized protein LOC126825069 isoform X3 [Patella vulgata]|uniref:uncharacterized protein LOC126825069 isoform X3 n=1 Tax=Patella vulgata TaxID=6465 RepID=UPI0024A9721A|nr:uncharacterized protein LOC126825069 isoform X3 [Patella vulgata]